MNQSPRAARSGLSVLSLRFQIIDDRPDWPVVSILVDGQDPFAAAKPGWRGFDPQEILGPDSPMLPADLGRRVAVYCCSCGEPGCGAVAPVIVASPDKRRVSWVDFREYTGVFAGPVSNCMSTGGGTVDDDGGTPAGLPDVHFGRQQYVEEIQRASRDRSWETSRRTTARLLYERLSPLGLVLPPDLTLAWVAPAWHADGVALAFEHTTSGQPGIRQQMLWLTCTFNDPYQAAADIAQRLLSMPPGEWAGSFGSRPA